MTREEFKATHKVHNRGPQKVNNSWGVYDYYKYYRTHRPNEHKYVLYECVYFAIIRKVNKYLAEEFCKKGEIVFPHKMGRLAVKLKPVRTWIDDTGKVVTTRLVDWDKTWDLWYENEEARKNKYLVYRQENKNVASIVYDKHAAVYKNKYYYDFRVCRELKTKLLKWLDSEGRLKVSLLFDDARRNDIKGLYDD